MTHALNQREAEQSAIQAALFPVQDDLHQVEEVLRRELRSRHPYVDELVRYGVMLGGKRLRPALLLLTAKAIGQVRPEHYTLAAVIEMIHTATLIHDDVLDDADIRRHLATVNARWNVESSVLLGDFLFTHAFYLASTMDSTLACQVIGKATNSVCEGEIRQTGHRGNFALSEAEYFEIIRGKTADLCACSCYLGAHYAGADSTLTEAMDEYGRCLGIAFQIADDLLDLAGTEESMGKSLGTDLEKQKPTLPVIHLLAQLDSTERERIIDLIVQAPSEAAPQLLAMMESSGSLDYTRQKAIEFANSAAQHLEQLQPSSSADVLRMLCDFVVARTH